MGGGAHEGHAPASKVQPAAWLLYILINVVDVLNQPQIRQVQNHNSRPLD